MHKLDASLLSGIAPFARLAPAAIREILDAAQPSRFGSGETVFAEGMPADRFFLLLDGYIRVIRTTPAGEQIIALHIPAGQLFGIAPALGYDHYPATAVTALESLVLSWPSRLWHDFVDRFAGFGPATNKTVGLRLTEMHERIVEMATLQVEQRIANAVLRLVHQVGRKTDEGIEIDFPITRQDLSEMTGSTLFTVSRLLSQWERDGIVKSTRKRVVVVDPHRLVMLGAGQGPH
jgi:CRP-like cAMP-binding protein